MTNEDFVEWLQVEHNCIFTPIEGPNITGWSVKITNPRFPHLYAYMRGPFTGAPIPNKVGKSICDKLAVGYPDCIME